MKKKDFKTNANSHWPSIKLGFFLAFRSIKRANKWTTGLIIFIMFLTFMNMVFVGGILSGLPEGSSLAYRREYSGDLILSNQESEEYISDSPRIISILNNLSDVEAVTPRLLASGIAEANYKEKRQNEKAEQVSLGIAGIDPEMENSVTGLKDLIIAGEYLTDEDTEEVLIGSNLLSEYSRDIPGDGTLSEVDVGSKIRVRIGTSTKELTIKGVIKSKIGEVGRRMYINDSYLRKLIDKRPNYSVNEIAVLLKPGVDPYKVKEDLIKVGICDCALIETWQESQGQFFKDISQTFNYLGILIGGIGVIVASITIFIIIFVNAVSRKKNIGILKGIGIKGESIEISYAIQSLFYSVMGSLIGLAFLYLWLKPYFDRNPIDFPFSDGLLLAPVGETIIKVVVLIIVAILAGFIPARIISRQNTLDSILGR